MKRKALLVGLLVCQIGHAKPRIAVLDFELNDITSLPNTVQERQRTASIRPLLEQRLRQDYEIIAIDADAWTNANAGFGYLFRHHELAAELGQQFGADWVIVGQHSKPSFLFSYLMVHLIRVKTHGLAARYDIELKGTHATVTEHGITALSGKIHDFVK